ncbi:hypothetical protein TTHERM_00443070 (macronuclear) [Tetrahymena thermophila SB210]|uniref:Uncharacterized protein n=1 Tax=Tetrahymena thermophila (strain SB210) TaxID=312017 RepID=I7MD61_TETTS|nr:hypothetical protein TTHERM_00443070 [Tetrahymena thermophila SB210]EAR85557.2 hypothetical protein TTHERM_00443070 [Tetrahymena thermophila SB210]|eukprot:XP_001033220.2 hypothetical protein TTHERM_00443070 [Tetrahymena thermophila SB210]
MEERNLINQEIENYIKIYDSIDSLNPINQSKLQEIKNVLELKVQVLEDEGDLVIYGYYKYQIAKRFLLHAEDRLKKKYENQCKIYAEQYNQYINLMNRHYQEEEEGKANSDENKLNQIKVEVQKIIQNCQKIDQTGKEQLQSFLNTCCIQFPCTSINSFRNNNSSFKQLYEYLDELITFIQSRYNISDNCHNIEIDNDNDNDNDNVNYNNNERRLAMVDCKLISDSKEQIGESFNYINMQFYESIYQNPDFIKNYYGEPVLDEIDFKRKRKIILLFISPDKYRYYFYNHKCQEQALNIMRRLRQQHDDYRDKIKKQINQSYQNVLLLKQMEENEEEAQRHFKKANNLRKMKLQLDDRHLQSSIEKEIALEINIAIKYFRICMKHADKMKILQKSIIYRNNIALCYYIKDASVLAQIYALGALHAILRFPNSQYLPLLEETKKVLSKVKGNSKKQGQSGEQQQQNQDNENQIQTSALIPLNTQQCALYIEEQLGQLKMEPFNQIMKAHYSNCGDYNIQRYQNFEQTAITNTKKRIIQAEVLGAAGCSIGAILSEGILIGLGISTFGLVSFLITPLFIYPAYVACQNAKKSYQNYTQLQQTRSNINSIVQESIKLHQKSQYLDFLNKLATPYLIEGDNQQSLIEITQSDSGLIIKYDNLIPILLGNGFRPDAVGYLMILLGESILGCKEYTEKGAVYQRQQKVIAEQIFQRVADNRDILNQAMQIDSKIAKIISNYKEHRICSCGNRPCQSIFCHARSRAACAFERTKDNFLDCISSDLVVDSKNSIAYSDVERQCYSSYEEKVKEIQDFASMNICLIRIINNDIDSAKIYLKTKLQKRQNFNYYFTQTEESWYVLQDLIHIFEPEFQIQQSLSYQILSSVDCDIVNKLQTLVENKQFIQASEHIRSYVTDEKFNKQENEQIVKQFYYWCTICFDGLNDRNAVMFYSSKYGIKEGRNKEQEKKIQEIRTKYLNQQNSYY